MGIEKIQPDLETPIVLTDDSVKAGDELENVLSQYTESPESQAAPPPQAEPEADAKTFTIKDPDSRKKITVKGDAVMTGALMMLLINIVLPTGISLLHNKFASGYKGINRKDLKLTKSQLADIEPLADEVAKHVEVSSNPITLFLIGLLGTYGFMYMELLEKMEPEKKDGQG